MKTRRFFITYLAANLGLVLYGVLALLMPNILLDSFFLRVYQFPAEATRAIAYLAALFRLIGWFNIIPGIFGLLLLRQLWFSRESWIRRVVIVGTILAYLGPIVFDNTVGSIGFFEIVEHILFVLVIFFGTITWNDPDAH